MGERTGIAWCHATFNPWMGCTKVGPGCDHCYAERDMALRRGMVTWGAGAPRRRTSDANWRKVKTWNKYPERIAPAGVRPRVFCASLADVFDNEVEDAWRHDLWDVIEQAPNLDWLLLTKRIGNVPKMLPRAIARLPNVWLGITVVNQAEVDRDVPKLRAVDVAGPRWLSVEPMLDRINLLAGEHVHAYWEMGVDWVVVGGESGPYARPMLDSWAEEVRSQCRAAEVPFFFKQGSQANWADFKNFDTFPPTLRVREFPQ